MLNIINMFALFCFVLQAGLIKMGAKFAPCMRSDKRLRGVLLGDNAFERETGCCVKSDDSGCIQTSEKECSVSCVHHTSGNLPSQSFVTLFDFKCYPHNLKANDYFSKPGLI